MNKPVDPRSNPMFKWTGTIRSRQRAISQYEKQMTEFLKEQDEMKATINEVFPAEMVASEVTGTHTAADLDVWLHGITNVMSLVVGDEFIDLTDRDAELLIARLTNGLAHKRNQNEARRRHNAEAKELGLEGVEMKVSR